MRPWKIIIADDHEMVRDGLVALLEDEDNLIIAGQAQNGEELLSLLEREKALDLIILDISMPGLDGLDVLQEVKAQYPDVKVLILSMYGRDEFIREAQRNGADGYILKNSGRKELLEAINALREDRKYFSKELPGEAFEIHDGKQNGEPTPELSQRERQVLLLLAKGWSSQEIADELHISKHTVDSHRKNITRKLKTSNPADLVMSALRQGLLKGFDLI